MAAVNTPIGGYEAELLIEPASVSIPATYVFDDSSERYTFDSESIRRTTTMIDATGVRGTRCRHYGRITTGNYGVAGDLVMRPGQSQLDLWLPRILYGTETDDKFALADAIPVGSYFAVLIDKVGDIHAFEDCIVSRCTFSASSGQPLVMRLEILGMEELLTTAWPGTAPDAFTYSADKLPVLMSTGTLTLGGSEYYFEDFECVVDNMIEVVYRNSSSPIAFVPQDRMVTLRVTVDYSDDLYGAETAIAGDVNFVPATGKSLKFNFPKLMAPKETPVITGKTSVLNDVTFTAYGDDYTDYTDLELYITNDLTGA